MKYRVKSKEYVTAIQMPAGFRSFILSDSSATHEVVDVDPGDWIVSFDDCVEVYTDKDFKEDFERHIDPMEFKNMLNEYSRSLGAPND